MIFAICFILFFALDILLVTQFEALGMVPMNYFVAGVGVFFLVRLRNHLLVKERDANGRWVYLFFYLFILFISVFNLISGIFSFLHPHEFLSRIWLQAENWTNYTLILFALFLSYKILRSAPRENFFFKWLLFSSIAGVVRFGMLLPFIKTPIILYRYLGIFDLIMVFGWLMIIIGSMHKEYRFGYNSDFSRC